MYVISNLLLIINYFSFQIYLCAQISLMNIGYEA